MKKTTGLQKVLFLTSLAFCLASPGMGYQAQQILGSIIGLIIVILIFSQQFILGIILTFAYGGLSFYFNFEMNHTLSFIEFLSLIALSQITCLYSIDSFDLKVLNRNLLEKVKMDEFTGLKNKLFLENNLKRISPENSIIFINIDKKRILDIHHGPNTALLAARHIGNIIDSEIENDEDLYYCAADPLISEGYFVAILKDDKYLLQRLEILRRTIETSPLTVGKQVVNCTISIAPAHFKKLNARELSKLARRAFDMFSTNQFNIITDEIFQ